jgi:hypothetical protein
VRIEANERHRLAQRKTWHGAFTRKVSGVMVSYRGALRQILRVPCRWSTSIQLDSIRFCKSPPFVDMLVMA